MPRTFSHGVTRISKRTAASASAPASRPRDTVTKTLPAVLRIAAALEARIDLIACAEMQLQQLRRQSRNRSRRSRRTGIADELHQSIELIRSPEVCCASVMSSECSSKSASRDRAGTINDLFTDSKPHNIVSVCISCVIAESQTAATWVCDYGPEFVIPSICIYILSCNNVL
jgi:hypothetical protein